MDAGGPLALLGVTYENIPRIVEPYSLVYKQRQDGHGGRILIAMTVREVGAVPA